MNNKYSDYIYAKQHDRNRTVEFTITENGKKKELDDTHCTFVMKGKEVVSFKHLVRSGDVYKMSLEPNDTYEAGKLPYQLILSSGEVDIKVDEHGEYHIIWSDDGIIIGTVTGYMLVEQCVVSDDDAATQFDTNILQDLLGAVQEAEEVIDDIEALNQQSLGYKNLSESYAKGGTGTREGEDTDNAKYYSEQAATSATTSQTYSEKTQEWADKAEETFDELKHKVAFSKLITLPVVNWSQEYHTQNVPVEGVVSDQNQQLIIVQPAEGSIEEYALCNVMCIQQGTNQLTFKCEDIPSTDLSVYVFLQGVKIESQNNVSYSIISDTEPVCSTGDFWYQDYTESIRIAGDPITFLTNNDWTAYSVPEDFRDFHTLQFILRNAPTNRITANKYRNEVATYVSGMNYENATLIYDDGDGYRLYLAIDSDGSNIRFYVDSNIQTVVDDGIVIHAI